MIDQEYQNLTAEFSPIKFPFQDIRHFESPLKIIVSNMRTEIEIYE